jgi:hypothetical protein
LTRLFASRHYLLTLPKKSEHYARPVFARRQPLLTLFKKDVRCAAR